MTTTNSSIRDRGSFSPSVNIIRDEDESINYIPTPNAQQVYNQLINDYQLGIRSFNIIGAYGTGKSSFIWALEKSLNGPQEFFSEQSRLTDVQGFNFLNIVGEYYSFVSTFAEIIGIDPDSDYRANDIIGKLDVYYSTVKESGRGLAIVVDEFGKFLEYAAQHNADYELYFIQQLAEYVNNTNREVLFLTTLHQDFNAYALDLKKSQRYEWEKVKGRLQELTFNEPVEQLLYLASKRLSEKKVHYKEPHNLDKLFQAVSNANAFPLRDYFNKDIALDLYPFDILSASVLTLALQRYGQNERSLFSFIESNDFLGINDFDGSNAPFYNVSSVYDYLIHNYYSLLTTKYNPHFTQWSSLRSALERAEMLEGNHEAYQKLIKTIGLLDLFAADSAKVDKTFLTDYARYSLGIESPESSIDKLEQNKIIRFVKHRSRYKIFEGTDIDIELAIDDAGNLVEGVTNIVNYINEYFEFPYLPAKAVYYNLGTPRFFQFKISEEPIEEIPVGEIDGFVNLIFNEKLTETELKEQSKTNSQAILHGWYQKTGEIKHLVFEIEKAKKAREQNITDRVAVREIDGIIQHQVQLLNHYIKGSLYGVNSPVKWFFKGEELFIPDQRTFNSQLSEICRRVYHKTPEFNNELVNKTKVSGTISSARRNLIKALFEHSDKADLGFPNDKFPPEKTIYLSLLKDPGIHCKSESVVGFQSPNEKFEELWRDSISFLNSTKKNHRNLKEFVDLLSSPPFKLKKGLIDFWLPIFLLIKRDDFALFGTDGYIPFLNDEILDLIVKSPNNYSIKAFNVDGVRLNLFNKYRTLLEQSQEEKPSNESFIQTIRPFLTFYRDLPKYAKQTQRLSKETLALRKVIEESKDPEQTFFEGFPSALGYSLVDLEKDPNLAEKFISQLQLSIKELRTCFDELLNRFEGLIQEEILGETLDFPRYKERLIQRFEGLKEYRLLQYQKTFYQRIKSPLEDRHAWLNALGQAVVGKPLNAITDEDEQKLIDKFPELIYELDNFTELSSDNVDQEKEEVLKLEVTDLVQGLESHTVRLSKNKIEKAKEYEKEIADQLGSDKQLNIYILTKILQEQVRNE